MSLTHNTYSLSRLLAAAALALTAGACKAGNNEISEDDYDDVAQGISQSIPADTGSMEDGVALAEAEEPAGLSETGSGEFSGVRGGLSYSYTITCQDSPEGPATACGDTTDVANLVVAWDGQIDTARYDATVSRTGDWTLSDIQSGTAAFNGDGTFDIQSEFMAAFRPATRTYMLDYDAHYDNVLFDVATREPIGGVATFDVSARRTGSNSFRDVEAEFDIQVVATFHDDGTVTLVLDGTRSYQFDLAAGVIVDAP